MTDGELPLNRNINEKCLNSKQVNATPYQNRTHTQHKTAKKIIVLDPGHGITGNKANTGTQIRLLQLVTSFGDAKFKIGSNYSWLDLPDNILKDAHKYFKYIENNFMN